MSSFWVMARRVGLTGIVDGRQPHPTEWHECQAVSVASVTSISTSWPS
jgi:hypothetical protein